MSNKRECAEKLYDAIGLIRDDFIADAENYTPKKSYFPKKLITALAACFAVVLCLNIFVDVFQKSASDEAPENEDVSLYGILEDAKCEVKTKVDLFKEEKLVWYKNGEYREKILTQAQYKQLTSYMEKGFKKTDKKQDETCLVWLCDGDGNVVSPYLETSDGNVYVELFSYRAEVVPNEEFTNYVQRILA